MEFSTRVGATYSNMIHAHVKGTQNHEEASVDFVLTATDDDFWKDI